MKAIVAICILGTVLVQRTSAQNTSPTANASTISAATTLTPGQECQQHNGHCENCVKSARCLYCYTDNICKQYPTGKVLPSSGICALDKARWGVCWLNFEALIISLSVIGCVLIISTVCCIYCCCCRGSGKAKLERDDAKFESQKMDRKNKQDERRTERKGRLDEIRKKYGLIKKDAPYQRFDS